MPKRNGWRLAAALGLLALPLLAPAEAVFALVLLLEGHARALRALGREDEARVADARALLA